MTVIIYQKYMLQSNAMPIAQRTISLRTVNLLEVMITWCQRLTSAAQICLVLQHFHHHHEQVQELQVGTHWEMRTT